MPITINEMKMPNNCEECEFHQSGYPDWCDLSCRCRDVFNPSIRPDWCPLEEAVPVVRCKDCEFSLTPEWDSDEVYCTKHNNWFKFNGYCHLGRKEDA